MPNPLENAPVVGMKKKFPRSFGRYVLEKSLSRGGMGEVFLAQAKGVRRRCVIKTIRGDLTGDEEFVGRFADEAKIMVRIGHGNIIRVFDAGKVDADYYIAMEFVHGRDLGDVLDRAYERGEPMPTHLGLYVTANLLKGLDYAHSLTDEHGRHMGLVHRDISPQNVLIGFDGSVKLIDFGLARTDLLPARTQGALAVGKYGYMSPEQARHERIDGRADIYSTGVMLFEVFTGDRLVDEQDQATLWQRVLSPKHRPPRSVIPTLPKEIDTLVMTAVGVRPEDRYQDAQEMLAFVETLRSGRDEREDFIRYLHKLYPKVDFSPPPVPDLADLAFDNASEHSIIIATSREGALSVFGRGELPIEWTRQIETAQRKSKRKKNKEIDRVITDAAVPSEEPRSEMEEGTLVRTHDEITADHPPRASVDAPTQIAHYPANPIRSEETAAQRPPPRPEDAFDDDLEGTIQSAPVLGVSSVGGYRDDEMTVMMSAPPSGFGAPQEPLDDDGDAPTRLSNVRVEDDAMPPPSVVNVSAAPPPPANTKGRAIREKVRTQDRRPERAERPERPERPVNQRQPIQVHRATVPTQDPADVRRTDPPAGFRAEATPEATLPEAAPRKVDWVMPALVVTGIALVIAIVAVFLTRM
ncbi:MAG: protein kinase [Deltaproteobacteria bacterium]